MLNMIQILSIKLCLPEMLAFFFWGGGGVANDKINLILSNNTYILVDLP
jgi:hypothetical protein